MVDGFHTSQNSCENSSNRKRILERMALTHDLYFQLMSSAQALLIFNVPDATHDIRLNNIYCVQAVQTAGEIYRQ